MTILSALLAAGCARESPKPAAPAPAAAHLETATFALG